MPNRDEHTKVLWSNLAARNLDQALNEQGLSTSDGSEVYRRFYGHLLARIFPQQFVYVSRRAGGFNPRKLQHALFVETFPKELSDDEGGRFCIVKIGEHDAIMRELEGWQTTCPPGFVTDQVLLLLNDTEVFETDSSGRTWRTLVYEDAQQRIGASEIVFMETAILNAARSDNPTCQSVADSLVDVWHRLHQNWYHRATVESNENTAISHRVWGLACPPHSLNDGSRKEEVEQTPLWESRRNLANQRWLPPITTACSTLSATVLEGSRCCGGDSTRPRQCGRRPVGTLPTAR